MNIMDKITGRSKERVSEQVVVTLTPLGKEKAEKFDLPGIKWHVLTILSESGACTIREIADEARINPQKAKAIVKGLIANGYVRKASAGE